MSELNFIDEPMSDEERLVMQETMQKQDIKQLQSTITHQESVIKELVHAGTLLHGWILNNPNPNLDPSVWLNGWRDVVSLAMKEAPHD